MKANTLYQHALQLARTEDFDSARNAFEQTVASCPEWSKPWVSYAQMEKRSAGRCEERFRRCRDVLQRALVLNPNSPLLLQAWGLLELQNGNFIAAVLLLERSVSFDPFLQPVLKWKPVILARQTVSERRRKN